MNWITNFLGIPAWFFQVTASGLIDALWSEIWHWGLGIGVMILCILGAFLSPVGKQGFAGAAFAAFLLPVAYGIGQRDRSAICTAQVKELYLKLHPKLNASNIAKNWRVNPNWVPGQPAVIPKVRPRNSSTCGFGGFGC